MRHAPGSWRFDRDNLNVYADGLLAQVHGHLHNGEREANARLISAAPDLLKACKLALTVVVPGCEVTKEILRQAIAKAESA